VGGQDEEELTRACTSLLLLLLVNVGWPDDLVPRHSSPPINLLAPSLLTTGSAALFALFIFSCWLCASSKLRIIGSITIHSSDLPTVFLPTHVFMFLFYIWERGMIGLIT
jgi:hypothetical protein